MQEEWGFATAPTSFLLTDVHCMGFKTSILVTSHRIAGFQKIESKMDRTDDGVITS
jgi:hypothetical protein